MVRYRRPTPQNVRNIGIWLDIMETLTRIAVITNAFIIAVTSDFIPQLVFKYSYSNPSGSLQGYVNFTLSYFDTKDLDTGNLSYTQNTSLPEICRWVILKMETSSCNIKHFILDFLVITTLPGLRTNMSQMLNFTTSGLYACCL